MGKCIKWILLVACVHMVLGVRAQEPQKGALLYYNPLSAKGLMAGWVMEGKGEVEFKDGWMQMYSPNEGGHHVYWCPNDFPADFIAEWQVQNLHPQAGLCIVFFCAKGVNGEDIFAASLPKRDGKFKGYTKGAINCYHISYYANAKTQKGRETANLRRNPGFHLLQKGEKGIPIDSKEVHNLRLVKQGNHIQLFVDSRKVIDSHDPTDDYLKSGKIGFRQMKWTRFAYRNFRVWSISGAKP